MVLDLFMLFATEITSEILKRVVGKIIPVRSRCSTCGRETNEKIGNLQLNYFECGECKKIKAQFTNVCESTIDGQSGQIAHAMFTPSDDNWEWVEKGGFWTQEKPPILTIPFEILADGFKHKSLILETSLLEHPNDKELVTTETVFNPHENRTIFLDHCEEFPISTFKRMKNKDIVIVKSRLISAYKDTLFEERRLVQPWAKDGTTRVKRG